jgi:hypothetical protein
VLGRFIPLLFVLLAWPAHAQFNGCAGGVCSVTAASGGGTVATTTTLDPANLGYNITLSNSNLTATQIVTSASAYPLARSVSALGTGKYYFEITPSGFGNFCIGIGDVYISPSGAPNSCGFDSGNSAVTFIGTSGLFINGASVGATPAGALGDTIGVAVDHGAQRTWIRDVSVSATVWNAGGTASPETGAGGYSIAAVEAFLPVLRHRRHQHERWRGDGDLRGPICCDGADRLPALAEQRHHARAGVRIRLRREHFL